MSGAAQNMPVGKDSAGMIGLVAGQPQRIDEQRKWRQRKGFGQNESDLQPLCWQTILTIPEVLHVWSTGVLSHDPEGLRKQIVISCEAHLCVRPRVLWRRGLR